MTKISITKISAFTNLKGEKEYVQNPVHVCRWRLQTLETQPAAESSLSQVVSWTSSLCSATHHRNHITHNSSQTCFCETHKIF